LNKATDETAEPILRRQYLKRRVSAGSAYLSGQNNKPNPRSRSGLPISVNWTFFARYYGWGATSDYRFKINDFDPTGTVWPKISGRKGRPPPTILILRKLGKCSFVWYKNLDRSFSGLSQCTRVTDGQTEFSSLDRVCIACSAVKTVITSPWPFGVP